MNAGSVSGQSGSGREFVSGQVARRMLGDVRREDMCRFAKMGLLEVRQLPGKQATYSKESVEKLLNRFTRPVTA
jgi:hypothetical protein